MIVGGESGPGYRTLDMDAARSIRDQCTAAGVPFFFKQDSGPRSGTPGPVDINDIKQHPVEAQRGT